MERPISTPLKIRPGFSEFNFQILIPPTPTDRQSYMKYCSGPKELGPKLLADVN